MQGAIANGTTTATVFLGNGTSHVSLNGNGTTTGGIIGDWWRVTLVAASLWQCSGVAGTFRHNRHPFGYFLNGLFQHSSNRPGPRVRRGGGGVTSIVAGTNITISPVGGTGAVTINSSGGGVTTTGAPANQQIAIFSAAGTITGTNHLHRRWDHHHSGKYEGW